ncbi:MAG: methyltransferase domain-containing protein [Azonexus sp.]
MKIPLASTFKTHYISLGENTAAVNSSLDRSNLEWMSYDVVSDSRDRFGLGFLVPFIRNNISFVDVRIAPGNVRLFRLEMTGHATRMQKGYLEFLANGEIVTLGEEVISARVEHDENGLLHVFAEFEPWQSRLDWLYLFAWPEGDAPGAFSGGELKFSMGAPTSEKLDTIFPKKSGQSDVLFIVNALQRFRNYLHVEFEIYKPDVALSNLWLISPEIVETAQWWTSDVISPTNQPGDLPDGLKLTQQVPDFALPSPSLLELFGVNHGWRGHCISAVYKKYRDVRYLDTLQSDEQLSQLKLVAQFSDGSTIILPFIDGVPAQPDFLVEIESMDRYRIPSLDRQPLFVEVGAHGPASSKVRSMVEDKYQYLGVDLSSGANVDVVGDAHLLSDIVTAASADVVFSHSVLEHLLAPIKFVIEANKVLRVGGLFIAHAPTCWPLHAEPWDYWRFSSHAWRGLLNENTGFEILEIKEEGDASIVPTISTPSGYSRMQFAPTPLFTSVIARKISETNCDYTAWSPDLAVGKYG